MDETPEQKDPTDAHPDNLSEQEKSLIYNEKEFLHRILEDGELARIILEKFVEEFPERLEKLKQAVAVGGSEDIRNLAHSIKGSAANISARSLSQSASQLEECGMQKDLKSAPGLLRQVEMEFEKFRRMIQ
jgi:HPt (histidine-containing phosphotransfer) domain-containing protein